MKTKIQKNNKDWQVTRLVDFETIDFLRGNGLRKSDVSEDGKSECILYGELYTKYKKPKIERIISKTNKVGSRKSIMGDVLVPATTTADAWGIAIARSLNKRGVIIGGDINILRTRNEEITSDFLSYFLNGPARQELASYATGTNIFHLSNKKIKEIQISYPKSLIEQKRIVKILDEAFEDIDKARGITEKNLKNIKELFESYLQDVFVQGGDDWEEKELGDVADIIGGYSFKSTDFKKDGKYQVIRMGNVRHGFIRKDVNPVFVTDVDYSVLRRALLLIDDVIITQTGSKNKRDYGFTAKIDADNYLLNQRIASIRFGPKCIPDFFLYFSWTNIFRDQYFSKETGTVGQGNVGIGAITNAKIPHPPLKTQKQIVKKLDALSEKVAEGEAIFRRKIAVLDELKKSLLKKAFSGEL